MRRTTHWAVGASAAAVLTAILVGCGTRNGTDTGRPGGAPESSARAPDSKPTATVELAAVRYAALDAAVKDQKGNVVLIDMWATW